MLEEARSGLPPSPEGQAPTLVVTCDYGHGKLTQASTAWFPASQPLFFPHKSPLLITRPQGHVMWPLFSLILGVSALDQGPLRPWHPLLQGWVPPASPAALVATAWRQALRRWQPGEAAQGSQALLGRSAGLARQDSATSGK